MKHFVEKFDASKKNLVLLTFANCKCHLSIQAGDNANNNSVTRLILPPHSSHKL